MVQLATTTSSETIPLNSLICAAFVALFCCFIYSFFVVWWS